MILRPCRFLEFRDKADTLDAKVRAVVVLCVVFAVRSSVDQRAEPIGNHLLFVLARIPREADDRKEVMIMIESRRWQKAVQ